jgi:hypothetical protein
MPVNTPWKEVARLAFNGERVVEGALDLAALGELSIFQELITATARAAFLATRPDRQRVPKGFEERTRLFLRKIEPGSAIAVLEIPPISAQSGLPFEADDVDPDSFVETAADLAWRTFEALERDTPLPYEITRETLEPYERFVASLPEDASVSFSVRKRLEPRTLTRGLQKGFEPLRLAPYEDIFDVAGVVLEVDVRRQRFQLWLDETRSLPLVFRLDQERTVTHALQEHESVRLRVAGRGRFSSAGDLVQILDVTSVSEIGMGAEAAGAPSLLEALLAVSREVPESEFDRLPSDLSENLDHYLYGSPKK